MCLNVTGQIGSEVERFGAFVGSTLVASLVFAMDVVAAGCVSWCRTWNGTVRT